MTLPPAVQRQVDAANALMAQEVEARQGNPAEAAPEQAPATDPLSQQTEIPATPASEPEPPAPAQDDQNSAPYWKGRFDVLQGKYNAEVPRLNQQLADLRKQLAERPQQADNSADLARANAENERLRNQLAAASAPRAPAPQEAKLRQEYGDDLIDGVTAMLEARVAPLQNSMQENRRSTEAEVFNQRKLALRSLVNSHGLDFDTINPDAGFATWLDEIDPMHGVTRRSSMKAAFDAGDIGRASLFFTSYASQRPTESRENTLPRVDPPVNVGSTVPTDANREAPTGRLWNDAEVKQLYENRRRNLISDEEFKRLELEMFAVLPNRVAS